MVNAVLYFCSQYCVMMLREGSEALEHAHVVEVLAAWEEVEERGEGVEVFA